MGWDVTFTCDICGKHKSDANHWWMATLGGAAIHNGSSGPETRERRLTLMRWSRPDSQNPDMYHLCGQGCALQAMERYMNEGTIDGQ